VVHALDLAELQRIDDQADEAVAGEPGRVVLVVGLVAVADTPLLDLAVTAQVEDRRQSRTGGEPQRAVEIGGDVESGQ
jgi:hypothetical protein